MRDPVIVYDSFAFPDAANSWSRVHSIAVGEEDDVVSILNTLLDDRVPVLGVHGDDAFLGRWITAHQRKLSQHEHKPVFAPMFLGDTCQVARALKVEPSLKKRQRFLKKAVDRQKLAPVALPTLKVSASNLPHAQYGFSFGAGALLTIFEAYHRSSSARRMASFVALLSTLMKSSLAQGSGAPAPLPGEATRVLLDGVLVDEHIAFVLASALGTTWFDVAMHAPASVRFGAQEKGLVRAIAHAQAPLRALRGVNKSVSFGRLHLDRIPGFVLDGALMTSTTPFVVQVARGPHVLIVA